MQTAFLLIMFIAGGLLLLMFVLQQIAEIIDHIIQGPLSMLDNFLSSMTGGHIDIMPSDASIDLNINPISIRTILGFLTFFGGAGYLFNLSGIPTFIAVIIAILCGWLGGWLIWKFTWWVISQSGSSHVRETEYIGRDGSVMVDIHPNRLGEIRVVIRGYVVTGPARSHSQKSIPAGAAIVITGKEGGVFIVEPETEYLLN